MGAILGSPRASPGAARGPTAIGGAHSSNQKPFKMLMMSFKNRYRKFQRPTWLIHVSWVGGYAPHTPHLRLRPGGYAPPDPPIGASALILCV